MPTATRSRPKRKATKKRSAKSIIVKFAQLSQNAKQLTLKAGSTLKLAMSKAGYESGSFNISDVKVNGKAVTLGYKVKAKDFITLSPRVQGGLA